VARSLSTLSISRWPKTLLDELHSTNEFRRRTRAAPLIVYPNGYPKAPGGNGGII
jgi:hypothetical protein